jgi:hypothetical protein
VVASVVEKLIKHEFCLFRIFFKRISFFRFS